MALISNGQSYRGDLNQQQAASGNYGASTLQPCRWCGMSHGTMCPSVKAIEFHGDGVTIKRVEFKTLNDFPPGAVVGALPSGKHAT